MNLRRIPVTLDRWQRGNGPIGLVYGVVKKFGDDNANQYVVALGWYGFVAIFPLLLVVITIFGFVGAPSLGHEIVSTLHDFPVVGSQFDPAHPSQGLQGSGVGLVIGLVGLIYGAQGVTQTVQQAMAGVWNVPQVELPNFVSRLARSLLALFLIGMAFLLNAATGTIVTDTALGYAVRGPALVGMVLLNVAVYLTVFRVTTPGAPSASRLLPGAALAAVGFTLLITVGAGLVQHQLRHSSATYGQFGLVIGLVGFLFLVAKITLYGAELNPVLARGLWPRGILSDDPTDADDRVLRDIARQARRRKDERIGVSFGEAVEVAADARLEG